MRNALFVALVALPLVACSAAVEGGSAEESVGQSQSEMANPFPTSYLIDFDRDPAGNALANGAIIDTVYTAKYGVTFTGIRCTPGASCVSGHAFAQSSVAAASGSNVVGEDATTLPFFDAKYGAVRADFSSPRVWASIDVMPVPAIWDSIGQPDGQPWLEAYDVNNSLIAQVHYTGLPTDADYYGYHTMRVDAGSARIKWVRFSVHPSSGTATEVFGEFDNLSFNSNVVRLPNPCLIKLGGC